MSEATRKPRHWDFWGHPCDYVVTYPDGGRTRRLPKSEAKSLRQEAANCAAQARREALRA